MKKVIVVILAIALIGLGYYGYKMVSNKDNNSGNKDTRKVLYTIKYNDMGIPGNNYDISIYDNMDVKVVKHPGCSTLECAQGEYWPSDVEHEMKFSESVKTKVTNEYLPKIFTLSNNIEISAYDKNINEETSKFLYAVIYKDDSNL